MFLINLFIDIFATSIIEVFVLRHVIPAAISSKASSIKEKIDQLITHLSATRFKTSSIKTSSKNSGGSGNGSSSSSSDFSVTDYFFISSYIAKKRPDIPESAIGTIIIIIIITIIINIIITIIIIIISASIQIGYP